MIHNIGIITQEATKNQYGGTRLGGIPWAMVYDPDVWHYT